MRLFFPLLMLIIFLPFSSASIEIVTQLEDVYNLGDKIDFSFKIVPNTTTNALVKLTLKCVEREVPYYIAPIELEEGKEIKIDALPIKAFSEGLCKISDDVESLEGENLERITSKEFTVSHLLDLSFTIDKTNVLPGDKIKIKGTASKKGDAIKDGSITIRLDNKKAQIVLDGKEFSYDLELDKNIKSGEHTIIVNVNGSYGNFNEKSVVINVEAIPTLLGFDLNEKEFKPKEKLELIVNLFDQANDSIKGGVNVKLLKEKTLFKEEIVIFDTPIEVNKRFDFVFNSSVIPNDYTLISSFGELEKKETITILPYSKIEMRLEGYVVFIKNIGNVKYNNETTIVMEKEDKTYFINRRIKLDVGEETTIDLSKEVPSGIYTITLPPETVTEEKIVEKVVEKKVPTYIENKERVEAKEKKEGAINVLKNVEIKDNRPLYKKGLSMITGGVIAGAGLLLSRPRFASFTMIILILSIIGYFSRKRIEIIIEKIRKKREKF